MANRNGVMPLEDERAGYAKMDGKTLLDFGLTEGSKVIKEVVEEAGVSLSDVSLFVPHQVNIKMINGIAEKLDVPMDKFFVNLYEYANMAGASVPVALDEALERNLVERGDLLVLAAFGGGLSWSASLIRY